MAELGKWVMICDKKKCGHVWTPATAITTKRCPICRGKKLKGMSVEAYDRLTAEEARKAEEERKKRGFNISGGQGNQGKWQGRRKKTW
tara:strand:+ start:3030 stop:3293 length:264 start_codon:yes stop_codon:yes gene_type:complete